MLCGHAFGLDREAFAFTNYELQVQLDPAQHGLAATGFVTLRNDSDVPQKSAALQISSSLTWIAIKLMPGEKVVTYVTHPYESDVDHTGSLSEAVVTLPQAVAPGGSVQLEVTYSGQILPDATRLEGVGAPKETAAANDWDQVSTDFTAVRGAGYVAWYPVAMEAVSLKDGHEYGLELGRWRAREAEAQMVFSVFEVAGRRTLMNDHLRSDVVNAGGEFSRCGVSAAGPQRTANEKSSNTSCGDGGVFFFDPLSFRVPSLLVGNYTSNSAGHIEIQTLNPNKEQVAALTAAEQDAAPVIRDWLGKLGIAEVLQLPQNSAAPFESGRYLFMPFNAGVGKGALEVRLVHTLAHTALYSPRPWIYEGVANFAQALMVEQQSGREAAIAYMKQQLPAMVQEEKENQASGPQAPRSPSQDARGGVAEAVPLAKNESVSMKGKGTSLIAANDELLYRSKGMYMWWMLRDMLGDAVIKGALAKYKPEEDKDTGYMQRLLEQEAQARRVFPKIKMEQFFDDWVYRDRGLPDFSVKSTFTRKLLSSPGDEHYMATIVVANGGNAGAEVTVTVSAGEHERTTQRLAMPARGEASIRVPTVNVPTNVMLNDGSVPESDTTNNSAAIAAPSEWCHL